MFAEKLPGDFRIRAPRRAVTSTLSGTAMVTVLALTLLGCGNNGTTGGTGTTSDAQLATVAAAVQQASQVPEWTAPGPPIDVTKLRGKSIFVIPITSQSAFEQQVEKSQLEIAKAAGVELTFYTNQGTVAEWIQGMNAGIAAKPDLIFLQSAPDPKQLQPQLVAAKNAGIPVIASHIWDTEDPNPPACVGCEGLTAIVKGPFSEAGRMMADWVIDDSQGKANVLMVGIEGLNSGDIVNAAGRAEYEENCPGCKVKEVRLALDQISDGPLQAVSSALTADPTIDYIVPTFDLEIAGSIASMRTSNRMDTKVISFGGTSVAMAAVADSNNPVKAEVAEPIAWTAYSNLDQAFRVMSGMEPTQESTPARLFTEENIEEAGASPDRADGFGSDFESGFTTLWNLGA